MVFVLSIWISVRECVPSVLNYTLLMTHYYTVVDEKRLCARRCWSLCLWRDPRSSITLHFRSNILNTTSQHILVQSLHHFHVTMNFHNLKN